MGTFIKLDMTGDTKSVWDKNNPDEVEAMRDQFDKLKDKGYVAYRVEEDGSKGEVMHRFDPEAGRVIMAPGIVGG